MSNKKISSLVLTVVTLFAIGIVYYSKNLFPSFLIHFQKIQTHQQNSDHRSRSNATSSIDDYPHFFPPIQYNCSSFIAQLPQDFDVITAGGDRGRGTTYKIDGSNYNAQYYNVRVEYSRPVVLVLTNYEPTIWSLAWAKNTNIVGVIATGYYHQTVIGLPKQVPILVTTEKSGECGYGLITSSESHHINFLTQNILKRDSQFTALAIGNIIEIGNVDPTKQLISSEEISLENIISSKEL